MKRATLVLSLGLIPFLFQACIPVTYTTYNANRYRLGRTFGAGSVHVTTSLASAPLIQNEGETTGIVSSVHSNGSALTCELTIGVLDRTDFLLSGGWGTGSGLWSVGVQQQLTRSGEPFALSLAPSMTFIDGVRDNADSDDEWYWDGDTTPFRSWIDSRMTVTELRVPMSYRFTRRVELLWGAGILYFDHRAEYGDSQGISRNLQRTWLTPVGSMGIRLGFITLEASLLSFDGKPVATIGSAARFHL